MADDRRHLTVLLLHQIFEEGLRLDSIRGVGVAHLADCERCAAIYRRFEERYARRGESGGAETDYGAVLERALAKTEAVSRRLDADRAGAKADLKRLLRLRPRARTAAVAADRRRFKSPVLVDLLIAECREAVRRDPREAFSLASMAATVAERVDAGTYGAPFVERLAVRALAHRANALRAGGELARAEALWEEVLARVEASPVGDRDAEAELASLEASLRQNQRRLDEADRLLVRAERLYRTTEDEEGRARVLLQRGIVAHLRPDAAAAATRCSESAAIFARVGPADLHALANLNLAVALCDLGRFGDAAALASEHRSLFTQSSGAEAPIRLAWIDGRIARGLGDAEAAEGLLLAARNGYLATANPFNASLVALDLAELYQAGGRTAEVKRLAEATVEVFAGGGVHREALRAATLFRDAAVAERLTAALLAHLRGWFAQAGRNPRLPFTPPG